MSAKAEAKAASVGIGEADHVVGSWRCGRRSGSVRRAAVHCTTMILDVWLVGCFHSSGFMRVGGAADNRVTTLAQHAAPQEGEGSK